MAVTLKNGFWVDENNNRWDENFYTQERAEELSKTLINCSDCSYCSYCFDCSDCSYCFDCSDCSDCDKTPKQYVADKIGSRKDNTRFYQDKNGVIRVVCGCFRGTLDEFAAKVEEVHGQDEYGEEYKKEIALAKVIFGEEQHG